MKKMFVVGASILQLPAILKAKEYGCEVAVADYNPNAVGIPYADKYYDVSTIDEEGVCAAAKDFGADGIMTLATDMPMRAVAHTCKKLGLVGISYDTAIKATDKAEMIRAFEKCGVAHPHYFVLKKGEKLEKLPENLEYPVISKPVDNAGSHGVQIIRTEKELIDAITYSSENGRSGDIIIEEYMVGPEVSVETLSVDGKCHVIQITDKLTTGAPNFVEMGHSQPTVLPPETVEQIKELAIAANRAVGITDGPSHTEIIVTKQGPKIVELGARLGGDCIATHLVPLSTGVDMVTACLQIALGQIPDITPKFSKGSAIRYFEQHAGTVESISGVESAELMKGIKQISVIHGPGSTVTEIKDSNSRLGFVIAQDDSPESAVADCCEAMKKIVIQISGVK